MNPDRHTELQITDSLAPMVTATVPRSSTSTGSQGRAHARPVVVVVEDDPQLVLLLWETLERTGYEAVPTEHGVAALAYLATHPRPACLLLDLDMSVMNGWALGRVLQQDPQLADIPVVLVSGLTNVAETAARLKAVAYLRKPFTIEQLLAVLSEVCGEQAP